MQVRIARRQAIHTYYYDHGTLPMNDKLSWRIAILPYLGGEGRAHHQRFKHEEPWDSAHNQKAAKEMPDVFAAPGVKTKEPGLTYYRGFTCAELQSDEKFGAVFDPRRKEGLSLRDIERADGAQNTIMVVEADQPVLWTKPEELAYDPEKRMPKLGGAHEKGCHALFCDGSVFLIPKTIGDKALLAMVTPSGKEEFSLEEYLVEERDRQILEQRKRYRRYRDDFDYEESSLLSPLSILFQRPTGSRN